MYDNDEDPNLQRSACDKKSLYPYEPYFDGKQHGYQLFSVEMVSKTTVTMSLNKIATNVIFT